MDSSNHLKACVITVSDSRSGGEKLDTSGLLLVKLLEDFVQEMSKGAIISDPVLRIVVPDEVESIKSGIIRANDEEKVDLIITTGGTGFAERDVTPEATKCLITKEAPGLVIALLNRSLQATPMAALSRLAAGIRGRTLIVNFPGSVKAVKECWEVLKPLLPHALDLLRGDTNKAETVHRQLGQTHANLNATTTKLATTIPSHTHHHHSHHHGHGQHHSHVEEGQTKSRVDTGNVAGRPRESPHPLITFEEAINQVLDHASLFHKQQMELPLLDSLNHILAEDIIAPDPQPPFPASIKDGYAVVASDGSGERRVISTSSIAGTETLPALLSDVCMRINTGAPVPSGADAVVQVEDTKLLEEKDGEEIKILICKAPTVGQDIRPVGCDVMAGQVVLTKGTCLTSGELGILASVGKAYVPVFQWPITAIMSTGDELVDPLSDGQISYEKVLPYGKIRDCNRAELMALLIQNGIRPTRIVDGGICPDDPDAIVQKLRNLFEKVDVLVTSGGVSMGERDLLKQILVKDFGFQLHFARVQMKPGKPTTFATGTWQHGSTTKAVAVFGLPGNPVSAWVTAQLYVLPFLRTIADYDNANDTILLVKIMDEFHLDPRAEFVRATFVPSATDGIPTAVLTDSNQMSSRLLSNRHANLLLMLPSKTNDKSKIMPGDMVPAMVIGRL